MALQDRAKSIQDSQSQSHGITFNKSKPHDSRRGSVSEEEGRTAFKRRNARALTDYPRWQKLEAASAQGACTLHSSESKQETAQNAALRKRSRSYLDEVLLERLQKRKRKRRAQNGRANL